MRQFFRTSGTRPPEMMVSFIDRHRDAVGVESICRTLQFAPSAYYERKRQAKVTALRSPRQKADEALRMAIPSAREDNFGVYGARKVWCQLRREGQDVARCTVERLMRKKGLQSVIRGRNKRTTIPADKDLRPLDLVQRRFMADRPRQLWVADLTLDALEQALWARKVKGGLIHHSDKGSQYLSIRYTERLAETGIAALVGST